MRVLIFVALLVAVCAADCSILNTRVTGVDAISFMMNTGADGVPVLVADVYVGRPGERHYMSVHFNSDTSGLRGTHAPSRPSYSQSFTVIGGTTFDEYVAGSTTSVIALTPGVTESSLCDMCSGRLGLGAAAPLWIHERVAGTGALVTTHGIYMEPESCDVIPYEMDINGAGDTSHSEHAATVVCEAATPEICITSSKYKGTAYRTSIGPYSGFTRLPAAVFDDWTSGKAIGNGADPDNFDDLCFTFEGTNGVDEEVCFRPEMLMDKGAPIRFWVERQDPLGADADLVEFGYSTLLGMAVRFNPTAGMAAVRPLPQRFHHTTFVLVMIVVVSFLLLRNYFGIDLLFLLPLMRYRLRYPVAVLTGFALDIATVVLPWLVFLSQGVRDAMCREVGLWIVLLVVVALSTVMYVAMVISQAMGAYEWKDVLRIDEIDRFWTALTNSTVDRAHKKEGAYVAMDTLLSTLSQNERRAVQRIWVLKQAAGGLILSVYLYALSVETAQGTLGTYVATMFALVLFIVVMHTHLFLIVLSYRSTLWYIVFSSALAVLSSAALVAVNHMTLIRAINWLMPEAGVAAPLMSSIIHGYIFLLVVIFSLPRIDRERLFVYRPTSQTKIQ